jgi:Tfp pilus tip-associated adhesin PilY1
MKNPARVPANKIRRHLLSLAGAALLPGTLLAQATVDPNTEPYLTLAPYVLKSSNLEPRIDNPQGGTRAYRPWFENGSWTGDLIEYEITSDGVRLIRSDVGRFPREGADWRGTGSLWSARYRFPDYQAYDQAEEFDPNWECTEEDANYWREPPGGGRPLFTMSAGNQVAFLWNSLSAAQRQALDAGTAADAALATDPYASPILNFVRGDRSNERCKEGGTFRWRFSVLGAIVNSTPVYVPAGADGLVMVGANDGMLHGFNAADGSAVFGYVPSMLMSKLGRLRISPYQPTHFVDGSLRARNIGTNSAPRHIVAGGLGAGGKGLFVLDVTDPAAPQVLTELAGSGASPVGDIVDARIGHIHGRPTIAELREGSNARRWYVVAGNGYLSDAGRARLVLVPVDGGTPVFIDTLDNTPGNGLSAPALLDANGDGVADFAYAGDLRGNLWRFNLNTRDVSLLFSAGPAKPITVEPDIGTHPDTQVGFIIYFGTGSLLSAADSENTAQQTVYGIWDRGTGATVSVDRLVTQTLTSATLEWPVAADDFCAASGPDAAPNQATVRFITNQQQPVWSGSSANLGWQVNLPRAGERLIGRPQIRAERIQFITTNPYDMVDEARASAPTGGSWIVQLDLASGGNAKVAVPLFDLNKNCALDPADGAPAATVVDGAGRIRARHGCRGADRRRR